MAKRPGASAEKQARTVNGISAGRGDKLERIKKKLAGHPFQTQNDGSQVNSDRLTEGFMKRISGLAFAVVTSLLALAILAQVTENHNESKQDLPAKGQKNPVEDEDYQVLETVLLDLIEFKEFKPFVGDGKRTKIVLHEKSAEGGPKDSSFYLSDGQLDGERHDRKPHLIARDIRGSLRRRNPLDPVSLGGYKPSSPKILVRDLSGLMGEFGEFSSKYADARGYVEAWLPGYSKDRQTAVLRAWFGPTAHGATVTYLLVKKKGKWTVGWRKVAYYV
jgi:hypothetical protein